MAVKSATIDQNTRHYRRRYSLNEACIKEGYLLKQYHFLQFARWKKQYFQLYTDGKLHCAPNNDSFIYDEYDVTRCVVIRSSIRSGAKVFQVMTPFRNLVLCTDNPSEMEDWISAIRAAGTRDQNDTKANESDHYWSTLQHVRPFHCNVCTEPLSGVSQHAITLNNVSCEVCKLKCHKRCLRQVNSACKWTTLASVGENIIEDETGVIKMPHQWMLGNLPVNAKCVVCEKTCGSIRRLQDFWCLWCRCNVHSACRGSVPRECTLGQCRISILPPTDITSLDSDGFWQATKPPGTSPLLVFINSKSGDSQGTKMLRRFRQLLNPAQVFDLMNGGPKIGLRLFQNFESFRVLVCGGDGSVSWVLNEIDRLGLQRQCQIGVLPLGTGNDLAQILGWGSTFDDDAQLMAVLDKMEHAQIKMLDRWSILTYESSLIGQRRLSTASSCDPISGYEDSVAHHLSRILHSDSHNIVLSSATVLCQTVSELVAKVGRGQSSSEDVGDDSMTAKCSVLTQKLDALLKTLHEESDSKSAETGAVNKDQQADAVEPQLRRVGRENHDPLCEASQPKSRAPKATCFRRREQLMCRANSLKKAIRQIIEHTEKVVDEQNTHTEKFVEDATPDELSCSPPTSIPLITTSTVLDDIEETDVEQQPLKPTDYFGSDVSVDSGSAACGEATLALNADEDGMDGGDQSHAGSCLCAHSSCQSSVLRATESASRSSLFIPQQSRAQPPCTSWNDKTEMSRRISSLCASFSPAFPDRLTPSDTATAFPILNASSLSRSSSVSSNSDGASPSAGSSGIGGFIGKMLLANADTLCAAASPLVELQHIPLDQFEEKCVMNNYFGIGLDAKISLDFNQRRDDHPEKCRSRARNLMFYGMLGGKEVVAKTFKNLEHRVRLECDGRPVSLPNLQGIVILNIPSYMGGTNFWGSREDDHFVTPSFDDKILEVVAVFNSVQLGVSRLFNLQRHRIAQCRSVTITILGDEGVPVHTDGEAWIQPPSIIRIVHKNRAQMLTRDKVFEEALKTWHEKQSLECPVGCRHDDILNDMETMTLLTFIDATNSLLRSVKLASINNSVIEQELLHLATQATGFLDRLHSHGQLTKPTHRSHVSDLVNSVRTLYTETKLFLLKKSSSLSLQIDVIQQLNCSLTMIEIAMKKVLKIGGLPHLSMDAELPEVGKPSTKEKNASVWRFGKNNNNKREKPTNKKSAPPSVCDWSTHQVSQWLHVQGFDDYRQSFVTNDIRGRELLTLSRSDLKELGINKVGHLKRIQQAIKELKESSHMADSLSESDSHDVTTTTF